MEIPMIPATVENLQAIREYLTIEFGMHGSCTTCAIPHPARETVFWVKQPILSDPSRRPLFIQNRQDLIGALLPGKWQVIGHRHEASKGESCDYLIFRPAEGGNRSEIFCGSLRGQVLDWRRIFRPMMSLAEA